jgi:hypothetical protein
VFLQGGGDQRCASVPDSNSQAARAATCFQDRLLIRPDDLHMPKKIPGVGIEPTASWFRARRHYQQQLPRIMRSSDTAITTEVRGEGFEPPSPGSKPGSLPLADPRSTKSALRESNSPRQLGRLEPLPLGQGHVKAEGGRVELPRHCCSTAFEAAAIANWLALPLIIQKLRWQESNLRRGG